MMTKEEDSLTRALRAVPDSLKKVDLVDEVGEALANPPSKSARGYWGPASLIALAAAALLWLQTAPSQGEAIRAKGSLVSGQGSADRWVGTQLYELDETGKPRRVQGRVHSEAALLFSFTNLGDARHLLIFGIAADGSVTRFFPGSEDEASLAIEGDAVEKEIPVLIRETLPVGTYELWSFYSASPLPEDLAKGAAFWRVPPPDTAIHVMALEVVP
jgi:hypothetical protein